MESYLEILSGVELKLLVFSNPATLCVSEFLSHTCTRDLEKGSHCPTVARTKTRMQDGYPSVEEWRNKTRHNYMMVHPQLSSRGPNPWGSACCFPRCIGRADLEWSSCDSKWHSSGVEGIKLFFLQNWLWVMSRDIFSFNFALVWCHRLSTKTIKCATLSCTVTLVRPQSLLVAC